MKIIFSEGGFRMITDIMMKDFLFFRLHISELFGAEKISVDQTIKKIGSSPV